MLFTVGVAENTGKCNLYIGCIEISIGKSSPSPVPGCNLYIGCIEIQIEECKGVKN